MKPELSMLTKSPVVGCESENIQNSPAAGKVGVESGTENPALPEKTVPKLRASLYEAMYFWLTSRQ